MIEKKNSYLNAKKSLDQIMEQIRSKDVPLEQALDLYEEAIRIGNTCAEMIDKADFSMEEIEAFNASQEEDSETASGDGRKDEPDAAGAGLGSASGEDSVAEPAEDADTSGDRGSAEPSEMGSDRESARDAGEGAADA